MKTPFYHRCGRAALLALSLFAIRPAKAQAPASVATEQIFAGVPQEKIQPGAKTNFALFDEKFYANELFLLGEAHGVQKPQEVDFELFKYLNQRAGVRYYVGEFDCSKAYYLNEYLRTGNDSTLMRVFRSWVRDESQWANKDLFGKFQKLRTLNLTLPARRQIRFVGLDELQDLPLAADYLAELLRGKKPMPAPLQSQLDSVRALLRQPATPALGQVARRTLQALELDVPARRRALGSSWPDLRHLLTNLTYRQAGLGREKIIFTNFRALYNSLRLEGEKLYGFWGLAHVMQSPLKGNHSMFAAMVRQSDLPLRDKVVSLMFAFSGCQMLCATSFLPAPWQQKGQTYSRVDKLNHDGPIVKIDGIEELKARTQPGSLTLFKLDAATAATSRQPLQVSYAPGLPPSQQMQLSPELPAAAYVQYLILVRNSEMVQPLRP